MKLNTKIILLVLSLLIIFTLAILAYKKLTQEALVELFQIQAKERIANFDKIIELKTKLLEMFVDDYTFWDDMVSFVRTKDKTWAEENIKVGSKSFGIDMVWVYDPGLSCVYSTCNLGEKGCIDLSFSKEILNTIFSGKKRFCHFFMRTPESLLEIRGATIHPTTDEKRLTEPQGYFLAAKLWDATYIEEIARITLGKINIVFPEEELPGISDLNKSLIKFSRRLSAWNDKTVAYLEVAMQSRTIPLLVKTLTRIYFIFVGFIIAIFIIIVIAILYWIVFPLRALSLALKNENVKYLEHIKHHKDEFGSLSGLIIDFLNQRGILQKEIAERKATEERLNQALQEEMRSRKILASMLDDNNRIREHLEMSLKELKQAQEILIQSEKLASLGKLVADMAHEVNNPLMIISGNAQLSLMDTSLSEEVRKSFKSIYEESNRAKSIIQRLLLFSKPSKGERKPVDINQSIELVVSLLEHQFRLSDVVINKHLSSGLPFVLADARQLEEVFMNLLNNSREAMPKGGIIDIVTSLEGEYIKIEIKDSGAGMDKETLAKIFDPFFTTKEKGTGLGLSVCYGIIKAHSGEIKFKSQPGVGTVATILLPVRKGEETNV
ncbi:MAG: ATP-binding protein [Candidatus Omnitrophica bacterium]|nr:ATP-binding protein [Candidatus Omnitrophota bacterium]